MTLETRCPICGRESQIEVKDEQYAMWRKGTLIQNAFPDLNADQREQLMTGICQKCWDRTFKHL